MSDETGNDEKEINILSDADVEAHLKSTIPKVQKLSEDEFRAGVVTDLVGLQVLSVSNTKILSVSNKNFQFIKEWMEIMEKRTKSIEEKLEFLEAQAKNDDPKKKTDHYLK